MSALTSIPRTVKMRARQLIAASAGTDAGCGIMVGWQYVFCGYVRMKNGIDIAIIVHVGLLISCLVFAGCTPPLSGYSIVDLRSAVMQPTFSMYRDPQVQLDIGTTIIWE